MEPLVCCELGNIYNKETLLQALLDKSIQTIFPHIRGLKDVRTLKITKNPAHHDQADLFTPFIVCPITKLELNGLQPFVVIWSTGYVLSEKAVKEVGIIALQEEYGPFVESDIIKLLPVEAEVDSLRAAMHHRRTAIEEAKKAAKITKKKPTSQSNLQQSDNAQVAEENLAENEGGELMSSKKNKKRKVHEETAEERPPSSSRDTRTDGDKPGSSSSLSAPVTKKPTTSSGRLVSTAMEAVKDNETKSAVYKSLFHKGHEKDRKDRDLFMTVAGLRYTLG